MNLEKAIKYLIKNERKREEFGSKSKKIIEDKFNWKKISKKILNYLPEIISNFMISKLKLHKRVKYKQEKKILDFFKYCKKVMINKSISFPIIYSNVSST